MDLVDQVEPLSIVAFNGRRGTLDWRGFHESPPPSLEEEIKRNPEAALHNRRARIRKVRKSGNPEILQRLKEEERKILVHLQR